MYLTLKGYSYSQILNYFHQNNRQFAADLGREPSSPEEQRLKNFCFSFQGGAQSKQTLHTLFLCKGNFFVIHWEIKTPNTWKMSSVAFQIKKSFLSCSQINFLCITSVHLSLPSITLIAKLTFGKFITYWASEMWNSADTDKLHFVFQKLSSNRKIGIRVEHSVSLQFTCKCSTEHIGRYLLARSSLKPKTNFQFSLKDRDKFVLSSNLITAISLYYYIPELSFTTVTAKHTHWMLSPLIILFILQLCLNFAPPLSGQV